MKVSFDFLSEPIALSENRINTLCIEDSALFRNIISSFYRAETDEANIVFSKNYEPFKAKGNICFIYDYLNLSYSASTIKKLYESIEKYCVNEIANETQKVRTDIISFMELIVNAYDFDFEYSFDVGMSDIFKMVGLKPNISDDSLLSALLDYILITDKYIKTKCFVLSNLHIFFNDEEINRLYSDLLSNHIVILVIENKKSFSKNEMENLYIYDKDLCEIVEK